MHNETINQRKEERKKKKHRSPTMKKSLKVESKDHAGNLALIQQLNDLQNVWKSLHKSRSRCSTASETSTTTITSFHHLLQKSPRTLMSSLQRRRVRNCSDGVEEILMDRRAAIMSGRFKGRQLFREEEYSGRSKDQHELLPVDKVVVEEEKKVAEKRGGDWRRKEKGNGCMLATACLAVVFLVFFSIIICNGKYMQELILVPT